VEKAAAGRKMEELKGKKQNSLPKKQKRPEHFPVVFVFKCFNPHYGFSFSAIQKSTVCPFLILILSATGDTDINKIRLLSALHGAFFIKS
jgi:hypothetical protein